jgi:hypothetical protein
MSRTPQPTAPSGHINIVPTSYQAIFILISFIILTAMTIRRAITIYHPEEALPGLTTVTPKIMKELGLFPNIVTVGLYIDKFQKFDMVKNDFSLSGTLWFLLTPGILPLKLLDKFELNQGTITERSLPNIKQIQDKLLVAYNIRANFSGDLDYKDFPYDDHILTLLFINRAVESTEVIFSSVEQFLSVNPKEKNYGWELVDKDAQTGLTEDKLDPLDPEKTIFSPAVAFSLGYSSFTLRPVLTVCLPLLLLFYIAVLTLSLYGDPRININGAVITAMLAYRFVLDAISPRVEYMMISDYFFFTILIATFIVLITMITDAFARPLSRFVKTIIAIILHCVVLGMSVYILL